MTRHTYLNGIYRRDGCSVTGGFHQIDWCEKDSRGFPHAVHLRQYLNQGNIPCRMIRYLSGQVFLL